MHPILLVNNRQLDRTTQGLAVKTLISKDAQTSP